MSQRAFCSRSDSVNGEKTFSQVQTETDRTAARIYTHCLSVFNPPQPFSWELTSAGSGSVCCVLWNILHLISSWNILHIYMKALVCSFKFLITFGGKYRVTNSNPNKIHWDLLWWLDSGNEEIKMWKVFPNKHLAEPTCSSAHVQYLIIIIIIKQ